MTYNSYKITTGVTKKENFAFVVFIVIVLGLIAIALSKMQEKAKTSKTIR